MKQKKLFENNRGVTNTTIATLVIVSLFVSMVGTWLILESFQSKYVTAPVANRAQQTGLVQLGIEGPVIPRSAGTTGLVTLNVKK